MKKTARNFSAINSVLYGNAMAKPEGSYIMLFRGYHKLAL